MVTTSVLANAIRRMGEVSRAYEIAAGEFKALAERSAFAEAEYRRVKGRFVTNRVALGDAVSKAEYAADGDDVVAAACMEYKMSAAVTESAKHRLNQLRTQVEVGRSVASHEREVDKLESQGLMGSA